MGVSWQGGTARSVPPPPPHPPLRCTPTLFNTSAHSSAFFFFLRGVVPRGVWYPISQPEMEPCIGSEEGANHWILREILPTLVKFSLGAAPSFVLSVHPDTQPPHQARPWSLGPTFCPLESRPQIPTPTSPHPAAWTSGLPSYQVIRVPSSNSPGSSLAP